eukprot:352135-Chlamydomonas_euryale.AAC.4
MRQASIQGEALVSAEMPHGTFANRSCMPSVGKRPGCAFADVCRVGSKADWMAVSSLELCSTRGRGPGTISESQALLSTLALEGAPPAACARLKTSPTASDFKPTRKRALWRIGEAVARGLPCARRAPLAKACAPRSRTTPCNLVYRPASRSHRPARDRAAAWGTRRPRRSDVLPGCAGAVAAAAPRAEVPARALACCDRGRPCSAAPSQPARTFSEPTNRSAQ